jgi:6-phosphogluconolactonase
LLLLKTAMQSNLSPRLVKFNDVDSLKQGVSDLIASHAISEIRKKGIFTIALSGGSMPQTLSTLWERSDINWSSVIILFADERCVTLDHPDSNFYGYKSILFDKIPIPESNIISIDNETNPEESALSYENRFLDRVPSKSIDLVLLGIGPDGVIKNNNPICK